MELGAANTGFVIGAYGLSAMVLAGLAIYTLVRDRIRTRAMERRKQP